MPDKAYLEPVKPLFFIGSSRDDLREFPDDVKDATGFALYLAQLGDRHPHARPLRGFGGAGVLEVVEYHHGNAFRTVYTVRLQHAVYVLHAFQKKSKQGIATPKQEIRLVTDRLRLAERHHATTFETG